MDWNIPHSLWGRLLGPATSNCMHGQKVKYSNRRETPLCYKCHKTGYVRKNCEESEETQEMQHEEMEQD